MRACSEGGRRRKPCDCTTQVKGIFLADETTNNKQNHISLYSLESEGGMELFPLRPLRIASRWQKEFHLGARSPRLLRLYSPTAEAVKRRPLISGLEIFRLLCRSLRSANNFLNPFHISWPARAASRAEPKRTEGSSKPRARFTLLAASVSASHRARNRRRTGDGYCLELAAKRMSGGGQRAQPLPVAVQLHPFRALAASLRAIRPSLPTIPSSLLTIRIQFMT